MFNFPLHFHLTWIKYSSDAEFSNFSLKTETFGNQVHQLNFVCVFDLSLYHVISKPIQCCHQDNIQYNTHRTQNMICYHAS